MEIWICKIYVKYAWKPMCKICSKSTTKAQEWREWRCSDVFIISFRGVRIDNPVKHLQYGASFCEIVNRQNLKFSTEFQHTPLNFEHIWLLTGKCQLSFLRIFNQFHGHIYSNISKVNFEKNSNNLMLK